jgi:hypothetical protein
MLVSDPGILGGTPVFQGTRMPVKALFDYPADGFWLGYFLETFTSVTREQAAPVVRPGWHRIESELASWGFSSTRASQSKPATHCRSTNPTRAGTLE